MNNALFYFLLISGLIVVAGSAIAFVAMRNAPEGFENEEGFIGLTKGDEMLLNEFASQRAALLGSAA
jgi:hypothetical protein